jgi:DNA-binding NarL/FixJ family response regulator
VNIPTQRSKKKGEGGSAGDSRIRVLIADDHGLVRQGIVALLQRESDFELVGEALDGLEAVQKSRALLPDVVIMDIRMPKMDGIEATAHVVRFPNPPKVVILSQYDDTEYVRRVMASGASGYILKESVSLELPAAIRAVHRGDRFFTPTIANQLLALYLKDVAGVRPDDARS